MQSVHLTINVNFITSESTVTNWNTRFCPQTKGIWENWFSMLVALFTAVTPCVVYCCAYYTLSTLAAPHGEQTRHVYLGHMKGATWCDFKGVCSFSALLEKYHRKDSWRKSHVCSISRWCWKWHCCSNHSFHTKYVFPFIVHELMPQVLHKHAISSPGIVGPYSFSIKYNKYNCRSAGHSIPGSLTFQRTDNGGRQEHLWDSAVDHHRVHNLEATNNQRHHGSRVKKRFPPSLSASPIRRHSTLCKLKLASFRWWRRAACPPLLRTFRRRCNDCPFFLLRKVLDSCDVTLSHLAHTKCLPRQNCSFDLFFLKAALLEGRHRKAELGLKHAEDAATHICTARNFLRLTLACSHLLGEKLTLRITVTMPQQHGRQLICPSHVDMFS